MKLMEVLIAITVSVIFNALELYFFRPHPTAPSPSPLFSPLMKQREIETAKELSAKSLMFKADDSTVPVNKICIGTKTSLQIIPFRYKWPIEGLVDRIMLGYHVELSTGELPYYAHNLEGNWNFTFFYYPHKKDILDLTAVFSSPSANKTKPPIFTVQAKIVAGENGAEKYGQMKYYHLLNPRPFGFYVIKANMSDWFGYLTVEEKKIANIEFIINYHLPATTETFKCDNGKTNLGSKKVVPGKLNHSLSRTLKDLMEDDKRTDMVTLKTKTNEIPVHRSILAKSSPVLNALVINAACSGNAATIDMQDFDDEVIEKFLVYLYTGEIHGVGNVSDQLMSLATRFELAHLKDICEAILPN